MTIRLDAGASEQIAVKHDTAATGIKDTGSSLPTMPDAGYGSGELGQIMLAVCTSANDLAVFNEVAAAQVREVGTTYAGSEAEVAATFTSMGEELS